MNGVVTNDPLRVRARGTTSAMPSDQAFVGVDVAKEDVLVVIRDSRGEHQRPWKAKQPGELRLLAALLAEIHRQRPLIMALESIGKLRPWPAGTTTDWEAELEAGVAWLDAQQDVFRRWLGRLEALLARHWPEATQSLDLNSAMLLHALAEHGGPGSRPSSIGVDQQPLQKGGLPAAKVAERMVVDRHVAAEPHVRDVRFAPPIHLARTADSVQRGQQPQADQHLRSDRWPARRAAANIDRSVVQFLQLQRPDESPHGASRMEAVRGATRPRPVVAEFLDWFGLAYAVRLLPRPPVAALCVEAESL